MQRHINFFDLTRWGKVRRVKEYAAAVFDTALTAVCYTAAIAAVWLVLVAFLSIEF
ncbi:hypothetical protein [Candidatus Avelusimicrobium stercoris]|uniref:hypothetical protein n=1 Tax=Candidatus Avelusimicrobium stercoris TaxID=1947924 RepID=UPI003D0A03A1